MACATAGLTVEESCSSLLPSTRGLPVCSRKRKTDVLFRLLYLNKTNLYGAKPNEAVHSLNNSSSPNDLNVNVAL
jgi:hypothetical protein